MTPDSTALLPGALILPEKTVTGWGTLATLFTECLRFGPRGLVLYGAALELDGRLARLRETLPPGSAVVFERHRGGEPSLDQAERLRTLAAHHRADWVAGIGGGSIMDLAKVAAALMHAHGPMTSYHDGAPIPAHGAAFAAVPTTAGTGAEATLNAVLTNPVTGIKKSIRAPGMMARLVILDAALLAHCPQRVMASSGLDALTQAIEAFTSRHANWLSDTLALQAVRLITQHLPAACATPEGAQAGPLLTGSYLGGVALSFARLGVVHGLAHPLGALYGVGHGEACAACLPLALEFNRTVLGRKQDDLAQAMGGDPLAVAERLIRDLDLGSPFKGQPLRDRERIITETLASGSTLANPRPVSRADVEWFLERLFDV